MVITCFFGRAPPRRSVLAWTAGLIYPEPNTVMSTLEAVSFQTVLL